MFLKHYFTDRSIIPFNILFYFIYTELNIIFYYYKSIFDSLFRCKTKDNNFF